MQTHSIPPQPRLPPPEVVVPRAPAEPSHRWVVPEPTVPPYNFDEMGRQFAESLDSRPVAVDCERAEMSSKRCVELIRQLHGSQVGASRSLERFYTSPHYEQMKLGLELAIAAGIKPHTISTLAKWATELDFPALRRARSAHKELIAALGPRAQIQRSGRPGELGAAAYSYIHLSEIDREIRALEEQYREFEPATSPR